MATSFTSPVRPFKEPPQHRRPQALSNQTNRRLTGLSPWSLHKDGVAIFMPFPMEVPPEFAPVSHVIGDLHGCTAAASVLRKVAIALVFCDIFDDKGIELVMRLASFSRRSLGELDRPTMVLVARQHKNKDADTEFALLSDVIEAGIDGVILRASAGLDFVRDVRNEVMKHCRIKESLKKHKDKVQQTEVVEHLREAIDWALWHYLPTRLALTIPPMDDDLHLHEPEALIGGTFTLGKLLGDGAHGSVYRLENLACPGAETGEVVKVIAKRNISTLKDLKSLSLEIEMMQMLSSSDEWKHPNIIKLHEVYHSPDHVLLRMENGGHRNLYRYLAALDPRTARWLPMGWPRATSIVTQCLSAVCHLHLGGLVHRDIKPENITISESPTNGVVVKLCDFGLACPLPESPCCFDVVGTFPFQAPEMLQPPYDPFPADIWSLGIVFLEVLCRCNVVVKSACKGKEPGTNSEKNIMTGMIGDYFSSSDNIHKLLAVHLRPELKCQVLGNLTASITTMVGGMLSVPVAHRLTADDLGESADVEMWGQKLNGGALEY